MRVSIVYKRRRTRTITCGGHKSVYTKRSRGGEIEGTPERGRERESLWRTSKWGLGLLALRHSSQRELDALFAEALLRVTPRILRIRRRPTHVPFRSTRHHRRRYTTASTNPPQSSQSRRDCAAVRRALLSTPQRKTHISFNQKRTNRLQLCCLQSRVLNDFLSYLIFGYSFRCNCGSWNGISI